MKEKGILTIHINIACPIDLMHATIARSGCHFCCCDCGFSIKVHCSTENKTTKSLDSQKDRNTLIWKRVLLYDPISIPFACFHRRTERNRKAFEKREKPGFVCTRRWGSLACCFLSYNWLPVVFNLGREKKSKIHEFPRVSHDTQRFPLVAWTMSLGHACVFCLCFSSCRNQRLRNLPSQHDQWFGFTGVIRGISIRCCTG